MLEALPLVIALCLIAVILLISFVVVRLRFDCKIQLERGRPDPPCSGIGVESVLVDFPGSEEVAMEVSTRAIQGVGGRDVSRIGKVIVTGWSGSMWTNIPKRQAWAPAMSWSLWCMSGGNRS